MLGESQILIKSHLPEVFFPSYFLESPCQELLEYMVLDSRESHFASLDFRDVWNNCLVWGKIQVLLHFLVVIFGENNVRWWIHLEIMLVDFFKAEI